MKMKSKRFKVSVQLAFVLIILSCSNIRAVTYFVNTAGDTNPFGGGVTSGATSGDLRWCWGQANASAGNTINFSAYPGVLPATISLASTLANITQNNFVLDGATAPGYNCATGPRIAIVSPGWGNIAVSGTGVIIRGISFRGYPFTINGSSNIVEGCWFNLDNTGNAGAGTGSTNFLIVDNSPGTRVGGLACGQGNVFSGFGTGINDIVRIQNTTNITFQGNYLGLGANGTTALNQNNAAGVNISSAQNITIDNNVIVRCMDGSGGFGIRTFGSGNTNNLTITNNKIGINATGLKTGFNYGCGLGGMVLNLPASNVLISGNIVCENGNNASCNGANSSGIIFNAGAPGITAPAVISNNYVGVDPSNNLAGNQFSGIYLLGTATGVQITGNVIGDNGKCAAQKSNGISFFQTTVTNTIIQGNYVGVAPNGTNIGNYHNGIELNTTGTGFLIGGTSAGQGNYIGFNKGTRPVGGDPYAAGILIFNTAQATIYGNSIGVGPTGGNAGHSNAGGGFSANNGIVCQGASTSRIIIGGIGAGQGNIIANSGTNGINVVGADFVEMRGNSIYCNGARGINLNCGGGANQGNAGYGCGLITVNTFTPPVSAVSGGRPNSGTVDVYGTNLCSGSCGVTPPQGQYRYGVATSYPTATTWSYNNGSTMFDDITATATGTLGGECSGGTCRTSEFSTCVDNTLPVDLLNFAAKLQEDGLVLLTWKTASETNNALFVIERSIDGVTFESIGTVLGKGNSSSLTSYQYIDAKQLTGTAYYRLKQVDLDGASVYSEIRRISTSLIWDTFVYPNPTQGELFVNVISEQASVEVVIYNMLGQIVFLENNLKVQNTSVVLNLNDLSDGLYTLQISDGKNKWVHKVVKDRN